MNALHGTGYASQPGMTDEQRPDDDDARRIDRSAPGADLPYDPEMTEPDEANTPDTREPTSSGDEELGRPDP